jgi:hypothetical protein
MFPLTRILTLAAATALVALTAASISARAEEWTQGRHPSIPTTVGQADLNPQQQMDECHLQRRAISRRACQVRIWREMHIDTAENQ